MPNVCVYKETFIRISKLYCTTQFNILNRVWRKFSSEKGDEKCWECGLGQIAITNQVLKEGLVEKEPLE